MNESNRMNEDTTRLLQECTKGCRMALESMGQVEEYIRDDRLKQVMEKSQKEHEEVQKKAVELLHQAGEGEKSPGMIAQAFSWATAKVKLAMEDDGHQIAKLMMDGCNMGIQSLSECRNDCTEASDEAIKLAEKLIRAEEDFLQQLKPFL